jgi:hypothetical protein
MTLNVTDTIAAFLQPVPSLQYPNTAIMQKALLKAAVTTGSQSLAAIRLLSLLFDLDISALFLKLVTPPDFSAPDAATLAATTSVSAIVNQMDPYQNIIRLSVGEAQKAFPAPTISILNDYNNESSPIYRVGVSIFVILGLNLQG